MCKGCMMAVAVLGLPSSVKYFLQQLFSSLSFFNFVQNIQKNVQFKADQCWMLAAILGALPSFIPRQLDPFICNLECVAMAMCKLFRASINDELGAGGEREIETRMMIKLNCLENLQSTDWWKNTFCQPTG